LAVLPFGGKFLSIEDVTKRVAPRREPEVRKLLYALYKRRVLDLIHGGGGKPYLYGRRASTADLTMPGGPKGERRAADVVGNAVLVVKILTGEIEETILDDGKDPAAVTLGRRGGKARAEGMSAKRRSEIARRTAKSRWKT
jgi:hypothetical protein